MMAALGTVFMLINNVIPTLTYISPMLASIALIPVVVECEKKYGWMTWAVTSILSLMLCADRESAFFYLFIGFYPILKPSFDRIPEKTPRILAKLLLFALAFSAKVFMMTYVLGLQDIKERVWLNIVYLVLTISAMFVFDSGYDSIAVFYENRIRRK